MPAREGILVLDFGSQYTQLIARRVRELGVYCEIVPHDASPEAVCAWRVKGIVLSGGPMSVGREGSPTCHPGIFDSGVPVLGICYGMHLMAHALGGEVRGGERRQYGRHEMNVAGESALLEGIPETSTVWMSHGDHVASVPVGFTATARCGDVTAAMEDIAGRLFALQFHPEVAHTTHGKRVLRNFVFSVCGCRPDWSMASFIREKTSEIRSKVGDGRVICALSGGVDSTVAATLVHGAVGDRQTCVFVDNGLLRSDEFRKVIDQYRDLRLNVVGVDESALFLDALKGVTDPELKRKTVGRLFIEVFEREARRLGGVEWLVQGTLYPDVIESVSVKGPSAAIKSHHNVGGLPERMELKLIEPLRELFKDEVRKLGLKLGIPRQFIERQPFPGPGLAVRILGDVTRERADILRAADSILLEEIRAAGLYRKVWQSFAVLLPVKSVGVMGDERTYQHAIAIRAVRSEDGMTADWARLPNRLLERVSSRIVNEVKGINRVVYDLTSKPPGTIEWE